MKDKVCLITGATSGLGKATAVALAKLRATIIIIGRNEEKRAETSVYLASSPEAAGVTGKYVANKKVKKSAAKTYDTVLQTRLWDLSLSLTGPKGTP